VASHLLDDFFPRAWQAMTSGIEEALGDTKRRFDDWINDQGKFCSRLTVIRASDGVPEIFEAHSASRTEARNRVNSFAASALATENSAPLPCAENVMTPSIDSGGLQPGMSGTPGIMSGMPGMQGMQGMPGMSAMPATSGVHRIPSTGMPNLPVIMPGMMPMISMMPAYGGISFPVPGASAVMQVDQFHQPESHSSGPMQAHLQALQQSQLLHQIEHQQQPAYDANSINGNMPVYGGNHQTMWNQPQSYQLGAVASSAGFNIHHGNVFSGFQRGGSYGGGILGVQHETGWSGSSHQQQQQTQWTSNPWPVVGLKRPTCTRPSEMSRLRGRVQTAQAAKRRNVFATAPGYSRTVEDRSPERPIRQDRTFVRNSNPAAVLPDAEIDDESDNHLTRLNELCQKGVASLCMPKYQYDSAPPRPGSAQMWECTATTQAQAPSTSAPVTITKVIIGRNKKNARRIAAKALLKELVTQGILTEEVIDTNVPITPQSTLARSVAMAAASLSTANLPPSSEVAAAVSVLNQLWQKERFMCKPKWSLGPISGSATERWKCDLLIKTKLYGDVEVSAASSQKKYCRQLAAFEAVKKLIALKMPGIESINVFAKPHYNVSTKAPVLDDSDDDDERDVLAKDGCDATAAVGANDEIADGMGGGDDDPRANTFPGADAGFGRLFVLPETLSVVVATCAAVCNAWIAENVTDGCVLGLYLDSHEMREVLKDLAMEAKVDTDAVAYSSSECRAICLSTIDTALLVCAHTFEEFRAPSNAKKVDIAADNGPLGRTVPCPLIAMKKKSWIPKSVKFLLEKREYNKYGVALDEGAMILRACHGISCHGLHDLSVASLSLQGASSSNHRGLTRPDNLVHDWLRRRLEPFSAMVVQGVDGLAELVNSTADVVAPAVPTAVACIMIQFRIAQAAESRRRKRYTDSDAYLELSNRLCLRQSRPPFVA
jgi:hypothetical protein